MANSLMDGRLALVTGAGRGIGEAIARQLADTGMRVVVADIDGANADRVASELGAPHTGRTVDVADESAVQALFDEVEADLGPVAVLVCVAGLLILPGGERPLIKDMTMDTWERSFAVNARGAFL